MGHKTNPYVFRLGITKGWRSMWVAENKKYKDYLREDFEIRKLIAKRFNKVGIERVEIERSHNALRVVIYTSRPGFVIGKGGEGIEALRKEIETKILSVRGEKDKKLQLKVDVEELRQVETHATLIAQGMAEQIEKRIPFRRVLKQTLEKIMASKGIYGAKVSLSGRLDGSEMSRTEWLGKGKIPLHTLRADIDYGSATAFNTYGTVGVKVWIYKGEVFDKKA